MHIIEPYYRHFYLCFRFIVENTVEQKIIELQEKKLQLAEGILSGAKHTSSNKLTLDDMKSLFNVA